MAPVALTTCQRRKRRPHRSVKLVCSRQDLEDIRDLIEHCYHLLPPGQQERVFQLDSHVANAQSKANRHWS